MKLISMTDFCLKLLNDNPPYNEVEMLIKISNYAQFLKQPLTLGMFVPTDEDGNVLKPQIVDFNKYQQAKERVLFKDFKIEICNNEIAVKMEGWGSILKSEMTDLTIEFLTKRTPTLTTTAIKQIGL